jgi:hypothetical protein
MAEEAAWWNWAERKRQLTMRGLWRLATWGTAAALSLLIAVLAGFSETGSQRLQPARAEGPPAPDPIQLAQAFQAETRRLAATLHALAVDRDQLRSRIASLERSVEDVTGSIKQQAAAAPPAAAPPAPPAPAEPAAAAAQDAGSGAEAETDKAEFGVELGGATSFDGVRALWASTRKAHAALFDDLHPIIKVREIGKRKTVELRLIAGPLATAEAAAELCATLTEAGHHCQPAAYEGQRLTQAEKPRKPAAGHKSKAKSASKPARPFQ